MRDKDDLHSAYALKTPDDSRRLYAGWAATYDRDFVAERGYILHRAVADAFAAAGGSGPVLDLGAGTGICGVMLAQHGLENIHATDIAPEMLAQAARKNVYTSLFLGDILAGLNAPDHAYKGIVSSGTFTCGHVGPEGLNEVARLLSPGGLAVISVRDVHFENTGFETKLLELEPYLNLTAKPAVRIYKEGSTGGNANDVALLLHLQRR